MDSQSDSEDFNDWVLRKAAGGWSTSSTAPSTVTSSTPDIEWWNYACQGFAERDARLRLSEPASQISETVSSVVAVVPATVVAVDPMASAVNDSAEHGSESDEVVGVSLHRYVVNLQASDLDVIDACMEVITRRACSGLPLFFLSGWGGAWTCLFLTVS